MRGIKQNEFTLRSSPESAREREEESCQETTSDNKGRQVFIIPIIRLKDICNAVKCYTHLTQVPIRSGN